MVARAGEILADARSARVRQVARAIDTGDTGLTVVLGLRAAVALVLGRGNADLGPVLRQQRADAALKALALAWVVTTLLPVDADRRVGLLLSLPAGRALVATYGAVEVALPFRDQLGDTPFVAELVRTHARAMGDRLLALVGPDDLEDAHATLADLVAVLERSARDTVPHAATLAEQLRTVVPAGGRAGAMLGGLVDVAAAGADALPVYRFLVARLAVEAALAMAKEERSPHLVLPDALDAEPPAVAPPPPPPFEPPSDALVPPDEPQEE
ncbi:MAG: hypothetical protein H6735_04720 [Alphaproteobacteria bacterium]|nr:hypothetical protein [Alphaproteobacteria bacterium]